MASDDMIQIMLKEMSRIWSMLATLAGGVVCGLLQAVQVHKATEVQSSWKRIDLCMI